jgi:hypothetical protein
MKLLLFIKNILKNITNTNNIVLLLELLRNANYIYIFLIAVIISVLSLFPPSLRLIPNPTPIIRIIPQVLFIIFYSVPVFILIYTILKHKKIPKHILTYSSIKGVSKLSNFFDYYYILIPVCLVTTGIVLITLVNVHIYFVLAGALLFFLGWYVLFMFFLLKVTFYNMGIYDRYNNITRANDIFTNYISSKETDTKYLASKEFTKYFKRVLDGIDVYFDALFDKRISIDSLQTKENITVKQLIIRYLPLYLSYCSETELNSFKIKLNSMANLIDNENMIVSLDILKIVYSIHQDIVTFLNQHSYVIPKNNLLTTFIYYITKKHAYFAEIFVAIFIIAGLLKFIIPDDILNNALNEIFDYTLKHNINYALIPPFLASLPIIYKFLNELNE